MVPEGTKGRASEQAIRLVGGVSPRTVSLAPTDAALGQTVVSDRRLPARIRQGLNVESGLNDGICVPIFLVALAVAHRVREGLKAGHSYED